MESAKKDQHRKPNSEGDIIVELGSRTYPIIFDTIHSLPQHLFTHTSCTNCVIVSNSTVGPLYKTQLINSFSNPTNQIPNHSFSLSDRSISVSYVEIEDGESLKTLDTYQKLVNDLLSAKVDRKTVVVALGGGVTTDIVGFAAATTLRGLQFVNVPTSLLAMVDASVGGKTGVNTSHGKNLVGAFHQPKFVLVPLHTLKSLPEEEIRCGLGEVVKHAVLDPRMNGDVDEDETEEVNFKGCSNFMSFLETYGEEFTKDFKMLRKGIKTGLDDGMKEKELNLKCEEFLEICVRRSCEVKAKVVAADEFESSASGVRALLNLGHTVGHAIEAVMGPGVGLRHGEAVAIGLLAETQLSLKRGRCLSENLVNRIVKVLKALELPTGVKGLEIEKLISATFMDKKREAAVISVTQPIDVGNVVLDKLTPEQLRFAFELLEKNVDL